MGRISPWKPLRCARAPGCSSVVAPDPALAAQAPPPRSSGPQAGASRPRPGPGSARRESRELGDPARASAALEAARSAGHGRLSCPGPARRWPPRTPAGAPKPGTYRAPPVRTAARDARGPPEPRARPGARRPISTARAGGRGPGASAGPRLTGGRAGQTNRPAPGPARTHLRRALARPPACLRRSTAARSRPHRRGPVQPRLRARLPTPRPRPCPLATPSDPGLARRAIGCCGRHSS